MFIVILMSQTYSSSRLGSVHPLGLHTAVRYVPKKSPPGLGQLWLRLWRCIVLQTDGTAGFAISGVLVGHSGEANSLLSVVSGYEDVRMGEDIKGSR